VRLKVVAAEEWQSDDNLEEVESLLTDFERKVKLGSARLAIGFTSQPVTELGKKRVGVTRGPLSTHILIREWWPPGERSRLEVLLHELGHYLGAAHSVEGDSAMRPRLGDVPRTRADRYPGFDPVSTLIMNLVAEEAFDRGAKRFSELTPATRQRLGAIYEALARALPDDPAAGHFLRWLGRPSGLLGTPVPEPVPEGQR
jgi:hypothetical protein